MTDLLDVIIPVFLIIGFGYLAARARWIGVEEVDGIMRFAQGFALPVLLFKNIATIELAAAFQPGLLLSFYIGAFSGFAFGFGVARLALHRSLPEAVAVGFACLFSNSLLLGVPITERAFGPEALSGNFAIISIHAPLLYAFGIMMMEGVLATQNGGKSLTRILGQIARGILTQPLVVGLALGFAVNLSGFVVPAALTAAVTMLAASALPAALFGLGGVLWRYRPEGDSLLIATVVFGSLILHPGITYLLGRFVFHLDTPALRSATVTAAMAPGVNAYMFAFMYGVGKRVAASSILVATGLCIGSVWIWLQILP